MLQLMLKCCTEQQTLQQSKRFSVKSFYWIAGLVGGILPSEKYGNTTRLSPYYFLEF